MSESGPVHILGIDHAVLRVRDVERSLHFYTEVLDATVERRLDEIGLIQLRAGAQLIDLVPLESPLGKAGGAGPGDEGRNLDHLALRIERFDEPALRAHLEKHGIEVGEVATRYGAEGNGPSIYVRDPDGNVIELKGPPEGGA